MTRLLETTRPAPAIERKQIPAEPERARGALAAVMLHAALLALAVVMLFPFAWMLCASFKQGPDLFTHVLLPWRNLDRLTLLNFPELFAAGPFGRWMLNSLFLSSAQTVLTLMLASMGGFALAKYRFRGRRLLMLVMLLTMLLPGQVLLPASYELIYRLGWLDSYWAILLPGAVSVFGMFLFMQASRSVPDELLEAGRIDGCSELRLWWDIALPIMRPMIGAFTLLSFMASWNSFLWPQVVLQNPRMYTLPIGLANLIGLPGFEANYGILMAGTLLSILPVAVLFVALQREFVSGLTEGVR